MLQVFITDKLANALFTHMYLDAFKYTMPQKMLQYT